MTAIARFAIALLLCTTVVARDASENPATPDEPRGDFRIATFNAYLNRSTAGDLLEELRATEPSPQIAAVAEIIQRVRPDLLLINEFDYDASGAAVTAFQKMFAAKWTRPSR